MSDLTISIDCEVRPEDAACEPRLSAPAQQFETETVTVKTATKTAYAFCARAARRLRRFITVRASAFAVVLESRVRAFIQNVFPKTGADILRQSAILNI